MLSKYSFSNSYEDKLVRPHLEYAVQVWSPTKEMGVGLIEKVQVRATKIPHSMRNLSYQMRLKRWGINRLEDRRMKGDLIEMHKSVNGLDEINLGKESSG